MFREYITNLIFCKTKKRIVLQIVLQKDIQLGLAATNRKKCGRIVSQSRNMFKKWLNRNYWWFFWVGFRSDNNLHGGTLAVLNACIAIYNMSYTPKNTFYRRQLQFLFVANSTFIQSCQTYNTFKLLCRFLDICRHKKLISIFVNF